MGLEVKSCSFPGGSDVKESACSVGDPGSIPGLGRSPGGGHGNALSCSGLENFWQATARGVAKSQTRLSDEAEVLTQGRLRTRRVVTVSPRATCCWPQKEGRCWPPREGQVSTHTPVHCACCLAGCWLCVSCLSALPSAQGSTDPFAPPSSGQESETAGCPQGDVLEIMRSGQVPPAEDGGRAVSH